MHFYSPPANNEEPYFKVEHACGAGTKNYTHDPQAVAVQDMRNREDSFSLDSHSFLPILNAAELPPIADESLDVWKQHTEQLVLAQLPHARKVVIFDTAIRRADPTETLMRPVRKVHIDQTLVAAWARAKKHLSASDYHAAAQGRVRMRIVNVWRALEEPVSDHPLAVLDASSLSDCDLVEIEHIYADYVGHTYGVKHNPNQRWWYWSDMGLGEVLMFACFDSLHRHVRCAHGSFGLSGVAQEEIVASASGGHWRKSLEVRCVVLG